MSIKNNSIDKLQKEEDLNLEFKKLQVELLKLEVQKKKVEIEVIAQNVRNKKKVK